MSRHAGGGWFICSWCSESKLFIMKIAGDWFAGRFEPAGVVA